MMITPSASHELLNKEQIIAVWMGCLFTHAIHAIHNDLPLTFLAFNAVGEIKEMRMGDVSTHDGEGDMILL